MGSEMCIRDRKEKKQLKEGRKRKLNVQKGKVTLAGERYICFADAKSSMYSYSIEKNRTAGTQNVKVLSRNKSTYEYVRRGI